MSDHATGLPDRLTRAERQLTLGLRIFCAFSIVLMLLYFLPGVGGSGAASWIHPPFVVNSVVKDGLFLMLGFLAAADVRRFHAAIWPIIAGHLMLGVLIGTQLLWGQTGVALPIMGDELSATTKLWIWLPMSSLPAVVFWRLDRRAQRARYGLRSLGQLSYAAVAALADVLVEGPDEPISGDDVARNVDRYLAGLDGRGRLLLRFALGALAAYPLLTLRPPIALMHPHARRAFLERRFYGVAGRRIPGWWRWLVQGMLRIAQQLSYVGYYGDARTHGQVGYVPFSRRTEGRARGELAQRAFPAMVVPPAATLTERSITADTVIIGSGAGAAIAARRLLELDPDCEIVMVERGRHVDPAEFTENEVEMELRLYAEGALQQSRDFRFQVVQGSCVGGSTVVNNAVCFDLPPAVLDRWNDPAGYDAGLDERALAESFARVRELIGVRVQGPERLNPGASKFALGVERLGLDRPPNRFGAVEANIAECVGCGYCNIGCAYGRKLSMLDTVLPECRKLFGARLKIISECRAERIETRGGRAEAVVCRDSAGRRLRIYARRRVIVAAGAISSSLLLQRSRQGGKNAGRRLAFNIATPMTAEFPEELHSYAGLQMSHFLTLPKSRGFALETWFNPVATQALVMPGWFGDHYRNMRRYAHMTAAGVLFPSDHAGRTVTRSLLGGPDFKFTATAGELKRAVDGLTLLGEIFLAAGATRVLPLTFRMREFRSAEALSELGRHVTDASDLSLTSAHPQGGNAISRRAELGVVDPDFKVRGVAGLYVTDASVFPGAVGVNPQLSVMAIADYAAGRICATP